MLITAPDIPVVDVFPGVTPIRLVPNWVNSASTKRWTPSPREVSSTTAAMPTAMPRMVRKLRSRCPARAVSDQRMASWKVIKV